jgi:hypothetical protein
MFSKLFDFGFQRSGKQAVGFYIVWTIILIVINAIPSIIATTFIVASSPASQNAATNQLVSFADLSAKVVGGVVLFIIALLMLAKKKQFGSVKGWIFAILGIVLGYFTSLIGLIFIAILSTMPINEVPSIPPVPAAPAQTPPVQ